MFRGPWKGGRESDGWFIDVPQVYYLGRKEQGRKRPVPKSHTGGALFLAIDNKSGERFTRRVSGHLTVTLQGLEAGVVLWVIEPVIDSSRVGNIPSPRTMGTFA